MKKKKVLLPDIRLHCAVVALLPGLIRIIAEVGYV